ncbi:methyltransferase domain-containing protein [Desulfogranum marinum]|uniref:class I SAM-dependent methyltransferase n=1 Tax=Desulfogranum marinum TaxID=453220 RepID=UPI0029C98659|nr:methyltransferase domain-containing protein [Desulfogranum marinum]
MQLSDVSKKYNGAARYYDRLTDIVFGRILGLEQYRHHAIDFLGNLEGATVLDVGCGTGRNFPLLVERVGEHGNIIGVDCGGYFHYIVSFFGVPVSILLKT